MDLSVVIDTNILLVSISDRSSYHWIYEALRRGQYQLLVSTEIALEYEEIIGQHLGEGVAHDLLNALERYPNVGAGASVLPMEPDPSRSRRQ